MPFRLTLEMAFSPDEFFRILPSVLEDFQVAGKTVRWVEGGAPGVIRLVPLDERRLGKVAVPRLRVEIAIDASEEEGERFMTRFRRGFMRGGG